MTSTPRIYGPDTGAAIGGLVSGGTAGSVLFVGTGSVLAQDNASFFWDDTNNRLGIGTASPTYTLEVVNAEGGAEIVAKFSASDSTGYYAIINSTGGATGFSPALVAAGTTTLSNYIVAQGTTDTGSNPLQIFRARIGAGTASTARPLFSWQNDSTEAMQLDALGRLRMNTAAAYSTTGLTSQGVLYYGSTGGVLTLAAFSSAGNTQFNLNTAVGSGTNATRFSIGSTGRFNDSPAAITASNTVAWTYTVPSDSGLTAATEASVATWNTATRTWATSGTVATQRDYIFNGLTYASASATQTFTNAATVFISTPMAGTNAAITSGYALWLQGNAIASTAEKILRINVSDDSVGEFTIQNLVNTDSAYATWMRATGAAANISLYMTGHITTDTGTSPGIRFDARVSSSTDVATRPLFDWTNNGTQRMVMAANGAITHTILAAASTAETLSTWKMSDDATAKLEILNGSASDATFIPMIKGTSISNNFGLQLVGATTTDSGTSAPFQLIGQTAAGAQVATRAVLDIKNLTTVIATFGGTTSGNAFTTAGGRIQKLRNVASTTITVAASDDVVVSTTGGAAVAVSLPASPETGRRYTIKDGVGDAGTNNITVTPAAGNIDGAGTYVMNANYEAATFVYNGTQWNVISSHN